MKQYPWFILLMLCSCGPTKINMAWEKQLIIQTLQKETQYFCERDLVQWQAQWSQAPFVSKMYAGEHEFEYFTDWAAIRQFTENHIEQNPDPIPLPDSNFDYEIHLLGTSAWVFFTKNADGKKVKETRFMVKENEKWKIARMETVY